MSLWSYEYDVYEIGVEACGVGLWIFMLGPRHGMYNIYALKIVSKRMETICQHRFLHFLHLLATSPIPHLIPS